MSEMDGVPAAAPPDPEALSRRIAELVADLVQPAKSDALDKLGEGKRAFDIATGWVRSKLGGAAGPACPPGTMKPWCRPEPECSASEPSFSLLELGRVDLAPRIALAKHGEGRVR